MDNFKDLTILCLIKIIRKFIPFLNVNLLEMCVFCYIYEYIKILQLLSNYVYSNSV